MNKDSLGDAWYQISPWYGFPSFLDLRFVPVLLTPTASDNNKWTGSVDNDNYTGLMYLLDTRECDARGGWHSHLRGSLALLMFNGRFVWQFFKASRNEPTSHYN